MTYEAIPAELRELDQWVIWRYELRDDKPKPTKVPYQAADPTRKAKSTDPCTWGSFDQAIAARDQADGIGYVFSAEDPFCGIDLDDCIDADRMMHPAAQRIVQTLDSYTELSPSRQGVHVVVRGQLNGPGRSRGGTLWGGKLEMYDRARFFSITGELVIP